jgi:DNA-binding CsgD family transcriptional regulator
VGRLDVVAVFEGTPCPVTAFNADGFKCAAHRAACRPAEVGFAQLTQRDREIASRLAADERVALLGESLGISPDMVRNHPTTIYRKVGLYSQTDLVCRQMQQKHLS